MSTNYEVLPKSIERLNYYNGQRLEAEDFQVEQEYHRRMRQRLNKAFYTSGIAEGLEVTPKEGDPHKVVVSPGLALDNEGRAIILIESEEKSVDAIPAGAKENGGAFLIIRYNEESDSAHQDAYGKAGSCYPSWPGPERVQEIPEILWREAPPSEDSNEIILAFVKIDQNCAVEEVKKGVRTYVQPIREFVSKRRTFALEGEKDIDQENYKRLDFHIEGGAPRSVTLYMRGERFSKLFYTEMGNHAHTVTINLPEVRVPDHNHPVKLGEQLALLNALQNIGPTIDGGGHKHTVEGWISAYPGEHSHIPTSILYKTQTAKMPTAPDLISLAGEWSWNSGYKEGHRVKADLIGLGLLTVNNELETEHNHTISFDQVNIQTENPEPQNGGTDGEVLTPTTTPAGVPPWDARGGEDETALSFIKDLRIFFDNENTDITQDILDQIQWEILGKGIGVETQDPLSQGTPAIHLHEIGKVNLSPGPHTLFFKVFNEEDEGTITYRNGGKIIYNLYVD